MIEVAGDRLRVAGPMVIASATALKSAGESALDGISVVDLADVDDADSAAVALLLAWTRRASERKQTITIANAPESIRSLAVLYGVADLLPFA